MKFKKLLAFGAVVLTAGSMSAQLTSGTDYFIKNVAKGTYLTGGNDYGTHASVSASADYFTLLSVGKDGQYNLDSHIHYSTTNHFLGDNAFVDAGAANLDILPVEGEAGVYTIGINGSYYAVTNGTLVDKATTVSDAAKWKFMTLDEVKASIASATQTAPMDATVLIRDANFSRGNHLSDLWTIDAGCNNKNLAGGAQTNMCAESFHSPFNIYQQLDVPNGKYELTAQGFYRQDGSDEANLPVFYANSKTMTFPLKTGSENSMNDASGSFTNGLYTIDPIKVTVTDGKLTVGMKNTNTLLWCIWDNLRLTYYGPVDLAGSKAAFDAIYSTASGLLSSKMNKTVYNALDSAVKKYKDVEYTDPGDYDAAAEEIQTAVDNANTSIGIYSAISSLNTKAEALDDAGKAAYASALSAYTEGTLETLAQAEEAYRAAVKKQTTPGSDFTGAIINPNFDGNINGWTDTFEGNLNKGYQGATYGSISKFMECWAGQWSGATAPYALPDGRLYQTLTDLPEGQYTLSADIIATQQYVGQDGYIASHADETGIYVFAESSVLFKSNACSIEAGAANHNVSFTFNTTAGNVAVGLLVESTNCNWAVIDNVKLVYNGKIDLTEYKNAYNNAKTEAEKISTGNGVYMGKTAKENLQALLSEEKAAEVSAYTAVEQYESAIKALNDAADAANASIQYYSDLFNAYSGAVLALDNAGKTYLQSNSDCVALLTAYQLGTLDETATGKADAESKLNAAIKTATLAQTKENSDMTVAIVNPSFETGNMIGWTAESMLDTGVKPNSNGTYTMAGCDGSYLFNTWGNGSGKPVSQTVTGLHEGRYSVSAILASDAGNTLVLSLNDKTATATAQGAATGVEVTGTADVKDGSLVISASAGDKWFKADNFRLVLVGAIPATKTEAESDALIAQIPTGKMGKDAKDKLDEAKKNLEADKTSVEMYEALDNAITEAKTSVKYYEKVTPYATVYGNLDEAGKAAVAEGTTAIMTAYEAGTLDESATLDTESIISNLKVAVKAQTTEGSDMTFLVSNNAVADWTKTGDPALAYNTWSTEADESGLKAPFVQAWVASGGVLGESTISHVTVDGLHSGTYEVGITARVFNEKQGETYPAGFSFTANGKSVDMVEAGTQAIYAGNSPEIYGKYAVQCNVTDGKLDFGFTIAGTAGNWLAFKDATLKLVSNEVEEEPETVTEAESDALLALVPTAKMNADLQTTISNAKTELEKDKTNKANYDALKQAIEDEKVQKSIDYYAVVTPYAEIYKNLDEAGKAAVIGPANAIVGSDYQNGTLDEEGFSDPAAMIETHVIGALQKGIKAQTTPGSDMTSLIVNPEVNGLNGWQTAKKNGNGPLLNNNSFEYWSYTLGTGSFDYYQVITGLHDGFYEVSAEMMNDQAASAEAFKAAAGVYGTSDGETTFGLVTEYADDKGVAALKTYSVKVAVTNGELRLGVKNASDNMPARWFVADNFKLKYVGELAVTEAESDALLATVPSGKMGAAAASGLSTAKAELEAAKTDYKKYVALKKAIKTANSSIDYYAIVTPYAEIYKNLDAAGKAKVGSPAKDIIGTDYEAGSLDEKQFPDIQSVINNYVLGDLVEGIKAQTSAGSDISYLALNGEWIAAQGNKNSYQTTSTESYSKTSFTEGQVLYQMIEGLQPNTRYEVKFYAVANLAGWDGQTGTGKGIAQIYANSTTYDIDVIDQKTCDPKAEGNLHTIVATTDADGVLEYGIKNIATGGCWYVVEASSIKLLDHTHFATLAVTSAKYGTFIAPFDVALPEGVKAYTIEETKACDGKNYVMMTPVEGTIPANTPVMLESENVVSQEVSGEYVDAESLTVGLLTGVYSPTPAPVGSYVLQSHDGVVAFYVVVDGTQPTVTANRAYLNGVTGSLEAKVVYFGYEEETAINAIDALTKGGCKIYTSNGVQVNTLQKGVNVIKLANGKIKKILVK